jgi:hypothetical protein
VGAECSRGDLGLRTLRHKCVELASNFPGVPFVKFRTRVAANAAGISPIELARQWLHVEFLDLTRQSKCVGYNRVQECALMRDEPAAKAVRPLFQFYSSLPANQLRLNHSKGGLFVTKVRNASGIDQALI